MSFIDRLVPSIDRAGRPLVAMLAFTLAVATAGQAQNPPPGSLEGFEPSGEFLTDVNAKPGGVVDGYPPGVCDREPPG